MLYPAPFFLAHICNKLFSGWGFAIDPTGGAHSASPNPLTGKREGKEEKERGMKGREQEGGGKGSKGRLPPLIFKSGYAIGLRIMFVISL